MAEAPRSTRPQAVLFACGFNSVRSPMAAALFKQLHRPRDLRRPRPACASGELDPFAVAALEEIGIDIAKHRPMTFEELEDWEGLNFDLIVTLVARGASQGAGTDAHASRPTSNTGRRPIRPPTEGTREQRLAAYREVRDQLTERIKERFRLAAGGNE